MVIPVTVAVRPSRMNKTEAAYAERLRIEAALGEIAYFAYEPVRLRIAEGALYTPDFMVIRNGKPVEFVEVKGGKRTRMGKSVAYWKEASRVRIRVAAEQHPWAKFVAVWNDGRIWRREEF